MTLRIFESVFYKSLIRACSFDNFLAASQNARSYGQTINHRALRICKKRIQKVLMLSPAASQNARSYGQTINHRALRICKKRIQKVLMLSPCILINIFSYLLSDSYNETLFKSPHSVYVKRY